MGFGIAERGKGTSGASPLAPHPHPPLSFNRTLMAQTEFAELAKGRTHLSNQLPEQCFSGVQGRIQEPTAPRPYPNPSPPG